MGSPSTSLATLRPDIAGSLMEFDTAMDQKGFIATRVLPVFEVGSQAGTFGKIPVAQLLQTRDTARAPGSGYARGKFTFTTDSFVTAEHGAEEPIDDREKAMYRNYFDQEVVSAARAIDAVLRNAEIRVAAAVFNATTFTAHPVTIEWSVAATCTPITDVETAVQAIFAASGMWPNSMTINRKVFRNLRNSAQIIDRCKAQGFMDVRAGKISVAQLQAVFDIEEIIVAGSPKNTANEGQAAAFSPIWSDEYCMIAKICKSNDIREPGLGRTFHWGEDGSTIGGTVETYRDETVRGDVARVRHDVQEKMLFTNGGYLLSNITA